jgi:hypothetical protein
MKTRNKKTGEVHPSPGCCPKCLKPVPDLLAQLKGKRALIISCPHCASILMCFPGDDGIKK